MGIAKNLEAIMYERFGRDSVISLATCVDNVPFVRCVDAYYEDGAFYILTYALSNKMKHIEKNPRVGIAGEWFTAQGEGENLGYFGNEENQQIADKMKIVFSEWIDNGHNNFQDENTIILRVKLTKGILYADGTKYEIKF